MARRTIDPPATMPTLHGHLDGSRGHDDRHRHDGGDKPHGHPDRSALGRVVAREEYVAPAVLDQMAKTRVSGLADHPATGSDDTDQIPRVIGPPNELTARGRTEWSKTDATVAGVVMQLGTLAEHRRFIHLLGEQTDAVIGLSETLARAAAQLADRQLVGDDVKRVLAAQVELLLGLPLKGAAS